MVNLSYIGTNIFKLGEYLFQQKYWWNNFLDYKLLCSQKKRHPFNFCEINIQQLLYVIVQSLFWNETIRME